MSELAVSAQLANAVVPDPAEFGTFASWLHAFLKANRFTLRWLSTHWLHNERVLERFSQGQRAPHVTEIRQLVELLQADDATLVALAGLVGAPPGRSSLVWTPRKAHTAEEYLDAVRAHAIHRSVDAPDFARNVAADQAPSLVELQLFRATQLYLKNEVDWPELVDAFQLGIRLAELRQLGLAVPPHPAHFATFADWLRTWRFGLGLRRVDVAALAGMSDQRMATLERSACPTDTELGNLQQRCGFSLEVSAALRRLASQYTRRTNAQHLDVLRQYQTVDELHAGLLAQFGGNERTRLESTPLLTGVTAHDLVLFRACNTRWRRIGWETIARHFGVARTRENLQQLALRFPPDPALFPSFAAWLQEWRVGCGLSQQNLAERWGMAPPTVVGYEGGTVRPSAAALTALHHGCGFAQRLVWALGDLPAERPQISESLGAARPSIDRLIDDLVAAAPVAVERRDIDVASISIDTARALRLFRTLHLVAVPRKPVRSWRSLAIAYGLPPDESAMRDAALQFPPEPERFPDLGGWLRSWRRGCGLSQRTFATLFGLAWPTISELESGQRRPTPTVIERLASMALDSAALADSLRLLARCYEPPPSDTARELLAGVDHPADLCARLSTVATDTAFASHIAVLDDGSAESVVARLWRARAFSQVPVAWRDIQARLGLSHDLVAAQHCALRFPPDPALFASVGAWLTSYRAGSGLPKEKLARLIGATTTELRKVERGHRTPDKETLRSWSRILHFDRETVHKLLELRDSQLVIPQPTSDCHPDTYLQLLIDTAHDETGLARETIEAHIRSSPAATDDIKLMLFRIRNLFFPTSIAWGDIADAFRYGDSAEELTRRCLASPPNPADFPNVGNWLATARRGSGCTAGTLAVRWGISENMMRNVEYHTYRQPGLWSFLTVLPAEIPAATRRALALLIQHHEPVVYDDSPAMPAVRNIAAARAIFCEFRAEISAAGALGKAIGIAPDSPFSDSPDDYVPTSVELFRCCNMFPGATDPVTLWANISRKAGIDVPDYQAMRDIALAYPPYPTPGTTYKAYTRLYRKCCAISIQEWHQSVVDGLRRRGYRGVVLQQLLTLRLRFRVADRDVLPLINEFAPSRTFTDIPVAWSPHRCNSPGEYLSHIAEFSGVPLDRFCAEVGIRDETTFSTVPTDYFPRDRELFAAANLYLRDQLPWVRIATAFGLTTDRPRLMADTLANPPDPTRFPHFSAWFDALARRAGTTYHELAAEMAISYSSLRSYRRASRLPRMHTLRRIRDQCGFSHDVIIRFLRHFGDPRLHDLPINSELTAIAASRVDSEEERSRRNEIVVRHLGAIERKVWLAMTRRDPNYDDHVQNARLAVLEALPRAAGFGSVAGFIGGTASRAIRYYHPQLPATRLSRTMRIALRRTRFLERRFRTVTGRPPKRRELIDLAAPPLGDEPNLVTTFSKSMVTVAHRILLTRAELAGQPVRTIDLPAPVTDDLTPLIDLLPTDVDVTIDNVELATALRQQLREISHGYAVVVRNVIYGEPLEQVAESLGTTTERLQRIRTTSLAAAAALFPDAGPPAPAKPRTLR